MKFYVNSMSFQYMSKHSHCSPLWNIKSKKLISLFIYILIANLKEGVDTAEFCQGFLHINVPVIKLYQNIISISETATYSVSIKLVANLIPQELYVNICKYC